MKKSFYFFTLLCASFFVSAQSNLLAGDIAFIGSNTSIGGQFADQVSFILLKDITASTKIIFTDKGWSDSEQKLIDMPGDGEYEWVADGNMDAGTVVTLDLSIDTGNLGSFNAFAIQGDQLFAIQGTTDNPSFIAGLHFNIKKNLNNDPITIITDDLNWDGEPSIDNQGNPIRNDESALPDNLVTGDTAIRLFYNDSNLEIESNNFQFSCEKAGEDVKGCKEELRKILHNSDNWDTNNSVGFSNLNESACPITLTNELTVTGLTGNNKIYDGTTYAIATGTAVLSGVNPEDDVFLGGSPVFTFASSSVGTGVVIITSGYTLSGQDAENYKLTQPTLSGDITAKELTITGLTGSDKVYDGTTAATATGMATLNGVEAGDDVILGGSPVFTFASDNVGTGITINTSGYTISGTDSGNYTLTQPTLSGDITAKELTITGLTGSDKVYDGTTAATATGMATLNGVEAGDDVILGGSPVFTFASDNVGTGITINTSGYTISGTDSGNYTLTQPTLSGDITAKELTITGLTGSDKVYDGTTAATATGMATLNGVEAGDDVILGGSPVFTFASDNVGTGITINTSGYTISGTDSGNYTLTQPTLSGDITAKELTITGITGSDKVYDDTTAATATGTFTLNGVAAGDDVFLGGSPVFTFASANVGTGITINTTGLTISGTDSANYTLTQPTLSGDITAKELTITGITGSDKVYDDTTAATATGMATLNGVEAGDDVILGGSPVFTFASANVGTGITINTTGYTISGTDSGNYTLTQPTLSGDITAKELTVTGISGLNKSYDGTTAASATGTFTLDGVAAGDDVFLGGSPVFTFASANVGTGITINTTGLTISGTDSANYMLTQPTLSGDITAKELTITGITGSDKVYDDTTAATATGTFTLNGVAAGDDVFLGGSPVFTFASANVGTGITINTTGLTISGTDSANYTLTQPTLSGDITAKELTITGITGDNKVIDCLPNATVTGTASILGVISDDDILLGGNPAFMFVSVQVGADITINTIGYTISGTDSGNYTLTQPMLSADILVPSAMCQDIEVALNDSGQITILPIDIDNESYIDCGWSLKSVSPNTFFCNDIGTNIVTLTIGDENGNISTCQSTVTVFDNVAPTVTVNQDIIAELDDNGTVIIKNLRDVVPVVSTSDNCEVKSIFIKGGKKNRTFTCNDIATNPNIRIIRVKDVNGNKTDIPVNIIVQDNIDPIPLANDIVVQLDDNGVVSVNPNDLDNGSSDNCEIASFNLTKSNFTCNDIGNNVVTFSVTDVNGNKANTLVNIKVKDNTGPTVTVNQDIIAELDKNGTVIIKNLRDVVPVVSASDNCEVKSIFIKGGKKNRTFTCNDIATNPNIRIIRVKDVNGNKTDIPVNIIVQDNIDPIPLANDIVVQLDDNGIVSVNPNDLDNGSSDNCEIGSFNLSKSDFTCNDIGNNGVTFSVTDVNGNTANTLVNIEVIGIELDYEYQDVTCFGLDDGMITLNYITPGAIVTVNNEIYDPNKLYPAGTYNIKAFYDSDNTTNCVVEESIEILEPENVTFDVTTTAVTCSGEIDGTITVSNLSAGAVYTIKKNGIGEDLSNQIYFEPGFYVVRAFLPVAANNDDLFDDIFYDNTCEATAFAVVFEDNNCSDRTNSLNAIDVSVYPNPVKDILNIRFDNDVIDSDITIEVHNLVGNKMYSNTFSSKAMVQPEIKINFSKFPSHVYYVNIITQQGSVIKKIILDR